MSARRQFRLGHQRTPGAKGFGVAAFRLRRKQCKQRTKVGHYRSRMARKMLPRR